MDNKLVQYLNALVVYDAVVLVQMYLATWMPSWRTALGPYSALLRFSVMQ